MVLMQLLVFLSLLLVITAAPDDIWLTFDGVTFEVDDWPSYTFAETVSDSVTECQTFCDIGCDFVVFNSISGTCQVKLTDKTDEKGTIFQGQTNDIHLFGEIRGLPVLDTVIVDSMEACDVACGAMVGCQFVSFDFRNPTAIVCDLFSFQVMPNLSISYRQNPKPLNYAPLTMGRIDVVGNTGTVCISAGLMPVTNDVLCVARPEYMVIYTYCSVCIYI